MSLHLITRVAAVAAVAASTAAFVAADLKGDYNIELVVEGTTYTGTQKTTSGTKGAYTGKMEFTSPSSILADVTGKTAGDSVTYEAKYEDKGRGCTGTLVGERHCREGREQGGWRARDQRQLRGRADGHVPPLAVARRDLSPWL